MPISCLTIESFNRLKNGLRNGELLPTNLVDKTTSERRKIFEKYLDAPTAKFVNTEFEAAMVSNQKNAMLQWAKETFAGEKRKKAVDEIESRLGKVNEILSKTDSFNMVEDVIAKSMGIEITESELAKITEFSNELKRLREKTDKYGNPTQEYFSKREELIKYLNSINPSSRIDVALGTIGRGSLLFGLKSAFLNVESNTLFGFIGGIERRIANGQISGLNSNEIIPYIKQATEIYAKTGYDIVTMIDVSDGFQVLGEDVVHSEGDGITRKVGRFFEKFAFRGMLGTPDVASMSAHFADHANISSTKEAYKEGLTGTAAKLRAKAIMLDSMNIAPKTKEGKIIRGEAQAQALYYTFKNDTRLSKAALDARKILNTVSGTRLGDLIVPFAKTPANVLSAGINYAGGASVKAANELIKAVKNKENLDMRKDNLRLAGIYMIQQGFGLVGAFAIAGLFDDDEYMPDYFSATKQEKDFARQFKVPFNSVKIGGTWKSMEYFSVLAPAVKAILHAKKYGSNSEDSFLKYTTGFLSEITKLPGVVEIAETVDAFNKGIKKSSTEEGAINYLAGFKDAGIDFFTARTIPAIIGDIAKGLDEAQREKGLFERVPIARESLPEKINLFGEKIKTESFLSEVTFGARSRKVRDDVLYNEMERLMQSGELPDLRDLKYVTGNVRKIRDSVGDEQFRAIVKDFGKKFKDRVTAEIQSEYYKRLDDDGKRASIDRIRSILMKNLKSEYSVVLNKNAKK